jgi:hypothetical protein
MSDCQPSDKAKRIIRAMAKAKLEGGLSDAHDIVDAIHGAIADHTPLSKPEIADIISGFGATRKATRTELSERLSQLRRDLKASFHPEAGMEARNAQRQKAIRAEIDKINRKIETGDFATAPRVKPVYDEETVKLQADLEKSRMAAQREIARIAHKGQSPVYRATSRAIGFMRAAILSAPTVVAHLAGASGWRLVSTLMEDAAGVPLRFLFPNIDRAAAVEGGGFGLGGHLKGLQGVSMKVPEMRGLQKNLWNDIKDKLAKGASDRVALYGKDYYTPHPWLDMVGKLHDVIKTPIERYAFARAYWRQSQNMRRAMAREGMTGDAIDKAMAMDSSHALIGLKSYEESMAAKLQGKNTIVDEIQGLLKRADQRGAFGQAGAALARYEMPIMKIPVNMASEIASYFAGSLKAGVKYAHVMKEAGATLSPEAADYIMRNLKKQTVGLGLMAIGWNAYEHFGGLYQEGKKPPAGMDWQDTEINGHTVSHHWTHSPFWGMMQAAATAHHVIDADFAAIQKKQQKWDAKVADYETPKGSRPVPPSDMLRYMDGIRAAAGSIIGDLPFVQGPEKLLQAVKGKTTAQKFFGESARQFIPGAIQYAAKEMDDNTKRYPQSFGDELRMGIPGHGIPGLGGREDVTAIDPKKSHAEE